MQNDLQFLIKLQSIDSLIAENKTQSENKSTQIQSLQQKIESLKAGSKAVKDKTTQLQLKKKQLEGEVENQEKIIKKHLYATTCYWHALTVKHAADCPLSIHRAISNNVYLARTEQRFLGYGSQLDAQ